MTALDVGGLESAARRSDPPVEPGSPRRHFPALDGLRAVAALAIVLTHVSFVSDANQMPFGSFLARLDAGVAVFFVLSGFLLYRPFVVAHLDGGVLPGLRSYLRRRVLRIFPAFWAAAAVIGFLFGINRPDTLRELIVHAGLVHIYFPDQILQGPVLQSWTLAVEISFYAFLPLFALAVARVGGSQRRRRDAHLLGVAALYAVSVLWRLGIMAGDPPDADMYLLWLPSWLDQFALGMGVAVASAWWNRPGATEPAVLGHRRFPTATWGLAGVCFAVVSLAAGLPTGTIEYSEADLLVRQFLYGTTGVLLLLPCVFGPDGTGVVRRLLTTRVMVLLGLVSYGIYLWHEAFIDRFLEWFDRVAFTGGFVAILAFTLVLSTGAATLSYQLVERHALALKRRAVPFRTGLPAVLVGALLVRLVALFSIAESDPTGGDPRYYHEQANLLAGGHGYAEPFSYLASGEVVPSAVHPPGFTTWLAGASVIGFDSFFAHKVMSVLAGVALVAVIGVLGRRLGGPRVGLLAAGAAALHPNLWVVEGILMPEALYGLTIALVILAASRVLDVASRHHLLLAGAAIALATLVRGEAVLLTLLLGVPLAFLAARRWSRRATAGLLLAVGFLVPLAPWVARNLTTFDRAVLISVNADEVLRNANCDETWYGDQIGFWSVACYRPEPPPALDEAQRAAFWRDEGLDYVGDHLDRLPVVLAARVGRVWDLYRPGQNAELSTVEGRDLTAARLGQAVYFGLIPLSIGGAVVVARRRGVHLLPYAVMPVLVTVTAAYAYGVIRFRIPAEVAMVPLAAVGVDALLRRSVDRRFPPLPRSRA